MSNQLLIMSLIISLFALGVCTFVIIFVKKFLKQQEEDIQVTEASKNTKKKFKFPVTLKIKEEKVEKKEEVKAEIRDKEWERKIIEKKKEIKPETIEQKKYGDLELKT